MTSNKSRIDMRHGFMKSIIQNQVDRDNYDKELKAKKNSKSKFRFQNDGRNPKLRKPDINVYVPPTKLKDSQNSLFQLEFENKDGEIFSTQIYPCDKGSFIANKIGEEMKLPPEYVSVLEDRIEYEISSRLSSQQLGD